MVKKRGGSTDHTAKTTTAARLGRPRNTAEEIRRRAHDIYEARTHSGIYGSPFSDWADAVRELASGIAPEGAPWLGRSHAPPAARTRGT